MSIDDEAPDAKKSLAVSFVTKFHNFDPRQAASGVKLFEIATSSATSVIIRLARDGSDGNMAIEIEKMDGSEPKKFSITAKGCKFDRSRLG